MAVDAETFTALESTAHDRIAPADAEPIVPLNSLALVSLLDAAAVSAGRTVLDVATGPGLAADAAAARGALVVGIDVSPGMIAIAGNARPGIDFRVGDVTALPFPNETFNSVICNFGLGHFPYRQSHSLNASAFSRPAALWRSPGGTTQSASACKGCFARSLKS